MSWKLKLVARYLAVIILPLLLSTCSEAQNRYEGVKKPESVNPYWKNYDSEVKEDLVTEVHEALKIGFSRKSLFELSFIMEELLKSYDDIQDFEAKWLDYVDSLKVKSLENSAKAGLIPLQAQFFHATLAANENFSAKYPIAYGFIEKVTPTMPNSGYKLEEYPLVLEKYGFSDIVGDGIMMDVLMLEGVRILEMIGSNQNLKEKYILWVNNLTDPSNEFEFSDMRPRLMLSRVQLYLVGKLKESSNSLAKITWKPMQDIQISRIRKPSKDSSFAILNGIWEGIFGNKIIWLSLATKSNSSSESELTGFSKFSGQDDILKIPMKGNFKDMGNYFTIELNEYRIPFKEEPKWKQDIIVNNWGGPEKFYPPQSSYGTFKIQIDKMSRSMKGTWVSGDGKLMREFSILKVAEGID